MKKITFILLSLAISLGAMAQGKYHIDTRHGTVTGGVKGAMNLPSFMFGKLPHGMRNGGQVGLWAEYKPSAPELVSWSVLAEAVFSSEGGKFTVNQALAHFLSDEIQLGGMLESANKDIVVTENYINIPVMLRYRFHRLWSVEAGPEVGVNVYSKAHVDGVDFDLGLGSRTHAMKLGIGVGATYYLTDYMMFSARWNLNCLRSFKDIKDHQSSIQLGAAFRF